MVFKKYNPLKSDRFVDPRLWPKGSYELGSVRPSVQKFFRVWIISFFQTQHGVRGPCVVVRDRARFFERNICAQKMGQKLAKIKVF